MTAGVARAVLGIDAAWTVKQPSGVALAVDAGEGWFLVAAAPSYAHFLAIADGHRSTDRPTGSEPAAAALLEAAAHLAGIPIDLVAIDMPLSATPIVSRRAADNAVSRAFGARKCSTHTPSATRPGPISDNLTKSFATAGYVLCTETIDSPGLIEVYPHPALLALTGAAERLPYKAGKIRSYWRHLAPPARREMLLMQWAAIASSLEKHIAGATHAMPLPHAASSAVELKAFEDVLDAIVCAWVAITALNGEAMPYGDEDAAIWIPAFDLPA